MVNQMHALSPQDILDGRIDLPLLADGGTLDDPVVVLDLDGEFSEDVARAVSAKSSNPTVWFSGGTRVAHRTPQQEHCRGRSTRRCRRYRPRTSESS